MRTSAKLDWGRIPAVVLDTSVLLAYLLDEPGTVDLEAIKSKARVPFMALCEMHYTVTRKNGRAAADHCFGLMKAWDVPILHSSEELILAASRLKDRYGLGIGDAFIAAASLCEEIPLLTYDSDFQPLAKEIPLLGLH